MKITFKKNMWKKYTRELKKLLQDKNLKMYINSGVSYDMSTFYHDDNLRSLEIQDFEKNIGYFQYSAEPYKKGVILKSYPTDDVIFVETDLQIAIV